MTPISTESSSVDTWFLAALPPYDRAAHWVRELNRTYRHLMAQQSVQQQERLRIAQRFWGLYRDANCGFHAAGEGSIATIEAAECLGAMTQLRHDELDRKANPKSPRN